MSLPNSEYQETVLKVIRDTMKSRPMAHIGLERNSCMWLRAPAERAIGSAITEIEALWPDQRLTRAQVLLQTAMKLVGDVIDDKLEDEKPKDGPGKSMFDLVMGDQSEVSKSMVDALLHGTGVGFIQPDGTVKNIGVDPWAGKTKFGVTRETASKFFKPVRDTPFEAAIRPLVERVLRELNIPIPEEEKAVDADPPKEFDPSQIFPATTIEKFMQPNQLFAGEVTDAHGKPFMPAGTMIVCHAANHRCGTIADDIPRNAPLEEATRRISFKNGIVPGQYTCPSCGSEFARRVAGPHGTYLALRVAVPPRDYGRVPGMHYWWPDTGR